MAFVEGAVLGPPRVGEGDDEATGGGTLGREVCGDPLYGDVQPPDPEVWAPSPAAVRSDGVAGAEWACASWHTSASGSGSGSSRVLNPWSIRPAFPIMAQTDGWGGGLAPRRGGESVRFFDHPGDVDVQVGDPG